MWYQKYHWVNENSYWMSLPYENGMAWEADSVIQEQFQHIQEVTECR